MSRQACRPGRDMSRSDKPCAPLETESKVLTVTELAGRIQRLLESGIGLVHVEGEVSGVRIPASGHCYFTLKDENATLNAVCFRSTLARQPVLPRDGMKLEIRGRVT